MKKHPALQRRVLVFRCASVLVFAFLAWTSPSLLAADKTENPPKLRGVHPGESLILREASDNLRLFRDRSKIVSSDGTVVTVWDMTTGEKTVSLKHPDPVLGLAIAPDERTLLTITGGRESPVRLWNLSDGKLIRAYASPLPPLSEAELEASKDKPEWNRMDHPDAWIVGANLYVPKKGIGFTSVAFSPTGREVVAGCDDESLILWKTDTGERIAKMAAHEGRRLGRIVVSPDGTRVLTCSRTSLALWDVHKQALVTQLKEGLRPGEDSLTFSKDGREFQALGWSSERVHDAATGRLLKRVALPPLPSCEPLLIRVAFLPDGDKLLVFDLRKATFTICDIKSGKALSRYVYTSTIKGTGCSVALSDWKYLPDVGAVMICEFDNGERTMHENWTAVSIVPLSEFKSVSDRDD